MDRTRAAIHTNPATLTLWVRMSLSSLADAIDRIVVGPSREIERLPLDDGDSFKALHGEPDGSFTIHHVQADGSSALVQTTRFQDVALQTFAAFDRPRDWHHAYRPRGENTRHPDKTVSVFAAGADPTACIVGFLDSLGATLDRGSLETLDHEDKPDFQWGYRFRDLESGTGFKAAGRLVPGGAIMTWWA
jgi:hypothetical protein